MGKLMEANICLNESFILFRILKNVSRTERRGSPMISTEACHVVTHDLRVKYNNNQRPATSH